MTRVQIKGLIHIGKYTLVPVFIGGNCYSIFVDGKNDSIGYTKAPILDPEFAKPREYVSFSRRHSIGKQLRLSKEIKRAIEDLLDGVKA